MKFIILILLVIIFAPSPGFSQDFVVFKGDTINRKDAKGQKQGTWRKYYKSDKLFSEGRFVNDVPVDTFKTFYETGEMQGMLVHSGKGKRSYLTSYHPSGAIKAKGNYIDQKKDSLWQYFDQDSRLTAEEWYDKGKENGTWKTNYYNGQVAEIIEYKNGKKEGPGQQFFSDGTIKREVTYKNDTFQGQMKYYHPNGKLWISGMYKNGIKDGKWLFYTEKGTMEKTEEYIRGILQGDPPTEEQ